VFILEVHKWLHRGGTSHDGKLCMNRLIFVEEVNGGQAHVRYSCIYCFLHMVATFSMWWRQASATAAALDFVATAFSPSLTGPKRIVKAGT